MSSRVRAQKKAFFHDVELVVRRKDRLRSLKVSVRAQKIMLGATAAVALWAAGSTAYSVWARDHVVFTEARLEAELAERKDIVAKVAVLNTRTQEIAWRIGRLQTEGKIGFQDPENTLAEAARLNDRLRGEVYKILGALAEDGAAAPGALTTANLAALDARLVRVRDARAALGRLLASIGEDEDGRAGLDSVVKALADWEDRLVTKGDVISQALFNAPLPAGCRERPVTLAALAEDYQRSLALFRDLSGRLATTMHRAVERAGVATALAKDSAGKAVGGAPGAGADFARVGVEMDALHEFVSGLPLGAPLSSYELSSGFGMRPDPFKRGTLSMHEGQDYVAPFKDPVLATASGKVVFAGDKGAYGTVVEVEHPTGVISRYGHLSSVAVKAGQPVARGQRVGAVGSTGRSTGPHLHYEVLVNGAQQNPAPFVSAGTLVARCS